MRNTMQSAVRKHAIIQTIGAVRVALCISGQMRTFRKCFDNLKNYVIDPINPDIFIHTWENTGTTTKVFSEEEVSEHIVYGSESSDEFLVTTEELNELYRPKKLVIEQFKDCYFRELDGVMIPEELVALEPVHHRSVLPLHYKIFKCNQLRRDAELESFQKYDIVIRLRPDLMINEDLPSEAFTERNTLWHSNCLIDPSFQVSDKFAISTPEIMDMYSSLFYQLHSYWQPPFDHPVPERPIGERLMFQHMKNCKIHTQPLMVSCDLVR